MSPRTLVLGVGNILWADEGFGVRAVEALDQGYDCGTDVELMDGGTRGLALLEPITTADRLLLLDAVVFGGKPGELRFVTNDDVPSFIGQKAMSLHQTGMQDVLSLANLQGCLPTEVALIGIEPEIMEDYSGGLTETVAAVLPEAVDLAVTQLHRWGHRLRPRDGQWTASNANVEALQREAYESGLPSDADTRRSADARYLRRSG